MTRLLIIFIFVFLFHGYSQDTEWTCSMHPQIRMPDNSEKCPLCHMDLIPVSSDSTDMDSIPLGPALQSRITTQNPVIGMIEKTVKIRARVIARDAFHTMHSLRSAGRIENLRISRAGMRIQTGDLLYELYSPTLITAQQDYLESKKIDGDFGRKQQHDSRIKLLWLGFRESLLTLLEKQGTPMELVPIVSDASGLITEVFQAPGAFATLGANVFRFLKDDRTQLESYLTEADIHTLKSVESGMFTPLGNMPDASLTDPVLEELTIGPNRTFRMLWEMSEHLPLGTEGTVHAITKLGPGLKIPNSALMFAGLKGVVFVLKEKKIETVQVKILHSGDTESLIEGKISLEDTVITQGVFSVDSEFQIQGKNSFIQQLTSSQFAGKRKQDESLLILVTHLTDDYLTMWQGLSDDDLSTAKKALENILSHLKTMDSERSRVLSIKLSHGQDYSRFKDLRTRFHYLSEIMIEAASNGLLKGKGLSRAYCPMALDSKGAGWIQIGNEVLNPYFGHSMLHCGNIEEAFQ